ncbi:MAG TPA: DUF1045 domain-containing protein [Candidatus Bathyarchaeia archaeon]|nr:DUF1045 domain-containing protein [Candidatus Bathyarchaeia archaeon]
MIKYIRLNIAFLPDQKTIDYSISLSQKLGRKELTYFTLDGLNYHPHVTIYSPEYPKTNLIKIIGFLKKITGNSKKVISKFTEVRSNDGYIWFELKKTTPVEKIHRETVEKMNPLRENHLRDKYQDKRYINSLDRKQSENIRNFGYPDVLNLYHPHLTITRFSDPEKATTLKKNIKFSRKIICFDRIGVFRTGEYGTCKELLYSFQLGK